MKTAGWLTTKPQLSAHMKLKTSEEANILIRDIIYSGSSAQTWLFHTFLITWLTKVPWGHMLFRALSWILHKLHLPPHKHPSIPTSQWANFPANRRHLRENYVCVCVCVLEQQTLRYQVPERETADEGTAASSDPYQGWSWSNANNIFVSSLGDVPESVPLWSRDINPPQLPRQLLCSLNAQLFAYTLIGRSCRLITHWAHTR